MATRITLMGWAFARPLRNVYFLAGGFEIVGLLATKLHLHEETT